MTDDMRPAEQQDLNRAGCLALLTSQRVGRVVLPGDEPAVVPVNYAFVDEAILFRSDVGSRAAEAHGEVVVFEVDAIDTVGRAGWSVIVRGVIEDVSELVGSDEALRDWIEPWAPGPKDRWMRLETREVTGRWVHAAQEAWERNARGYL